MGAKRNILGQKFNKLTVIEELGSRKPGKIYWKCRCDCGNIVEVCTGNLTTNQVKSCGCFNIKHNMTNSKFYAVWSVMKYRCKDLTNEGYGGRGITYDSSWEHFENFYNDMFSTYAEGLSLDRIDNNGNYSKENCRWTTRQIQSRNMRKPRDNNLSKYRNVSYDSKYGKYFVRVRLLDGTYAETKYFDDEYLAAKYVDEIIDLYNLPNIRNFNKGEN